MPSDWDMSDEDFWDHHSLSSDWSEVHSRSESSDFEWAIELGPDAEEVYFNAFANPDMTHDERMQALHDWYVDVTGYYDEKEWEDRYSED